jgi:rod shape-determining protein MreD
MRRVWLAAVLLAVALVLQLTVIDGLHLPRGGEPDLVLVLVVVLAMSEGPLAGTVTGFAAGLCVDIAPPGSPLVGQYALVFCLAGWAAGSLGRLTKRSPLRALAVAALVIAAAEAFAAVLGKALEPNQVSVAEIRQFLPISIAYDLVICPFILYLVILATTSRAGRGAADSALAGTGLLGAQARSKRAGHKPRRVHHPRLDPAAARAGDGWVGGRPGMHPGSKRPARRAVRLHPSAGVPGSASGYAAEARLPARPVKLTLSGRRRGDGAIGSGHGRHWQSGRHPGLLAGPSHQIRFGGEPGGSAARKPALAAPWRRPLRINFRGTLGGSAGRQHGPVSPSQRPVHINFRAHGGGTGAGNGRLAAPGPVRTAVPRLRMGGSRSALSPSARVTAARSVPTVHFHTAPKPIARRPAATPKFGRRSRPLSRSTPTTGLVPGGVLEQSTFRARRNPIGTSRLKLSGKGPSLGMLGGSGQSTLRRPPSRSRKQPRFGYGRRSMLTFLTRRRLGGRWLAKQRAGRRSGAWLIGRRTGGLR